MPSKKQLLDEVSSLKNKVYIYEKDRTFERFKDYESLCKSKGIDILTVFSVFDVIELIVSTYRCLENAKEVKDNAVQREEKRKG